MAELAISDLHFHDGSLLDLVYSRPERLLRMSILVDFLQNDQPAVQVDLVFEQVSYLLCTDLEPWGPSSYIYSGGEGDRPPITRSAELEWDLPGTEKVLHIVMQSGDDIFIGYKQATVSVRAE